jgi:hypothetical protein
LNSPNPANLSVEDPFKAEKLAINVVGATKPLPFMEKEMADPVESTTNGADQVSVLSGDETRSCFLWPPNALFTVPSEIQINPPTMHAESSTSEADNTPDEANTIMVVPTAPDSWKPTDFLPMRSPTPTTPKRKSRAANSWQSPRPTQEASPDMAGLMTVLDSSAVAPFTEHVVTPSPSVTQEDDIQSTAEAVPSRIETDVTADALVSTSIIETEEETVAPSEIEQEVFDDEYAHSETETTATLETLAQPLYDSLTKSLGDLSLKLPFQDDEQDESVDGQSHRSSSSLQTTAGNGWEKPDWASNPVDMLKNKGVPVEKNIEWEKPAWTKTSLLRQTSKADILKREGNLARPITFLSDEVNKASNRHDISWEKPDWTKAPTLKATDKGVALKQGGEITRSNTFLLKE